MASVVCVKICVAHKLVERRLLGAVARIGGYFDFIGVCELASDELVMTIRLCHRRYRR